MNISNDLVEKYNEVYKDEANFWTFLPIEERLAIMNNIDCTQKSIIDVGCGTGDFAAWMATSGAKYVVGIDASKQAIWEARHKYNLDNLIFINGATDSILRKEFHIVTMIGVLEHADKPKDLLKSCAGFLLPGGRLISSSPYHGNPRGAIWLAMKYILDLPISLTDKHEFTSEWMYESGKEVGLNPDGYVDVDHSWGNGSRFIEDFRKRLPKVCPKVPEERIKTAMDILESYFSDDNKKTTSGANRVYFFTKPKEAV